MVPGYSQHMPAPDQDPPKAFIEFVDGRYFSTYWFRACPTRKVDLLMALWRDPGQPWQLVYRFRYHKDDKIDDTADEFSYYEWSMGAAGEAEILKSANAMIDDLPFSGPIHKILLRTDRVQVVEAALARESFAHFRSIRPGSANGG